MQPDQSSPGLHPRLFTTDDTIRSEQTFFPSLLHPCRLSQFQTRLLDRRVKPLSASFSSVVPSELGQWTICHHCKYTIILEEPPQTEALRIKAKKSSWVLQHLSKKRYVYFTQICCCKLRYSHKVLTEDHKSAHSHFTMIKCGNKHWVLIFDRWRKSNHKTVTCRLY